MKNWVYTWLETFGNPQFGLKKVSKSSCEKNKKPDQWVKKIGLFECVCVCAHGCLYMYISVAKSKNPVSGPGPVKSTSTIMYHSAHPTNSLKKSDLI